MSWVRIAVLDSACGEWCRNGQYENSSKAFKEGFADFAAHIALDNVGAGGATPATLQLGCSTDYDDNAATPAQESKQDKDWGRQIIFDCNLLDPNCRGAGYPTNVARALCDWYDERFDGLDARGHTLDHVHATLRDAYAWIGAGNLKDFGFGVCDLLRYHVQDEFPGEDVTAHSNILVNNGITCEL